MCGKISNMEGLQLFNYLLSYVVREIIDLF